LSLRTALYPPRAFANRTSTTPPVSTSGSTWLLPGLLVLDVRIRALAGFLHRTCIFRNIGSLAAVVIPARSACAVRARIGARRRCFDRVCRVLRSRIALLLRFGRVCRDLGFRGIRRCGISALRQRRLRTLRCIAGLGGRILSAASPWLIGAGSSRWIGLIRTVPRLDRCRETQRNCVGHRKRYRARSHGFSSCVDDLHRYLLSAHRLRSAYR
jgi:hypothetical protein